jgi:hypothetical protein
MPLDPSDRVYCWRLLLEEFGPKIMYINDIHNTVADTSSQLEFGLIPSEKEKWMTLTKCWCHYAGRQCCKHLCMPRANDSDVCKAQQRGCDLSVNSTGNCPSTET